MLHHGVDLVQNDITYQDVPSSVPAGIKPDYDQKAAVAMRRASQSYSIRDYYRPFATSYNEYAGDASGGIPTQEMLGYSLIQDRSSTDLARNHSFVFDAASLCLPEVSCEA